MRYALSTLSVLLLVGLSGRAVQAQAAGPADTVRDARSVLLRAPSEGIIYLRMGEPGGVRIRSRHGRPPQGEDARQPEQPSPSSTAPPVMRAESESPDSAAASSITQRDLDRLEQHLADLEDRLLEQVTSEFDDLARDLRTRRSPPTVVLGRGAADARTPEAEGGRRQDAAGAGETDVEPWPADSGVTPRPMVDAGDPDALPPAHIPVSTLTRAVEQAMLTTGLFRSLDVLFETDEATLLPTARRTLDAVGQVMQRYPDLRIEVQGHADWRGPTAYNQDLSEARARAVRAYLIETFPGISAERVGAVGFGEGRPVAEGTSPTGLALNRRVEFHVINPEALE